MAPPIKIKLFWFSRTNFPACPKSAVPLTTLVSVWVFDISILKLSLQKYGFQVCKQEFFLGSPEVEKVRKVRKMSVAFLSRGSLLRLGISAYHSVAFFLSDFGLF
jgi:hypothetical protein